MKLRVCISFPLSVSIHQIGGWSGSSNQGRYCTIGTLAVLRTLALSRSLFNQDDFCIGRKNVSQYWFESMPNSLNLLAEHPGCSSPHYHGMEKQAPCSLRRISKSLTVMLNSILFPQPGRRRGQRQKCVFLPILEGKGYVEEVSWML